MSSQIPAKPKLGLSKSQYLRGLQCPKSLYLHKYHEDLNIARDELPASEVAKLDRGTNVGAENDPQ